MSVDSDNVMASNLGQKIAEQFMCLLGNLLLCDPLTSSGPVGYCNV